MARSPLQSPVVPGPQLVGAVDEHSAALDAVEARAAAIEASGVPGFDSVALLVADTTLTYSSVTAGDIVRGGLSFYEVAQLGESAPHLATAGGVKLFETGNVFSTQARFADRLARGDLYRTGDTVFAAGVAYVKNGGSAIASLPGWSASLSGSPYDIRTGFLTTPTASQVLDRIMVARAITFPANFAGSAGAIATNPAASLVLTIAAGVTTIGTITVSTGGAFTFATTGGTAQAVAAGTLLTLTAPATPVTSAADAAVTLLATL